MDRNFDTDPCTIKVVEATLNPAISLSFWRGGGPQGTCGLSRLSSHVRVGA